MSSLKKEGPKYSCLDLTILALLCWHSYDEDVGTEAPGFLVWDSGTYVMYLSSVGSQGNAALRVLLNTGDDLLKGWTDLGEMHDNNGNLLLNYDGWAFVHPNGKRYM